MRATSSASRDSVEAMTQFGAHVDQSDPIQAAKDRGADIVQMFIGDPQSWKKPALGYEGGPEALRREAEEAGVGIYVHAPYIINVASTNNRIRIPSRKLLQQTLDAAAEIGALGVIVHGGHVTADDQPEDGFTNWRKAIDALKTEVPVLIENTAGGNNAMMRHLEAMQGVWDALQGSDNLDMVGFCLDTCHAFAAGLDLTTVVDDIRGITGRIDLVHLNDSQGAAGSGADRHANLGDGQINPDELAALIRDADAPLMLETPGDAAAHTTDLNWAREALQRA